MARATASGTPWEDVDAIAADAALTPTERSARIANRRCVTLRDAVLALAALPQTWSFARSGATFGVTLHRVVIMRPDGAGGFVEDEAGGCLGLEVTATRNGQPVRWTSAPARCVLTDGVVVRLPFVWVNPPLLEPDAAGTVTRGGRPYRYSPAQLVRTLLDRDVLAEVGL